MKVFLPFFTLIILLFCSGCYKEKEIHAVIEVLNEDQKPVSGATVFLHALDAIHPNGPGDFSFTDVTDGSGKVYMRFSLEAIYTIEAEKDSLFGKSSVRLKRGETVEQTVVVR